MTEPGTITSLVNRLSDGELLSRDDLFPVVYAELHGMVRQRLRGEQQARKIGATDLVHGVFAKLFGGRDAIESGTNGIAEPDRRQWQNRAHFFGAAARAMEQILVDLARDDDRDNRHLGARAMGSRPGVTLDPDALVGDSAHGSAEIDVLALAEALRELEEQDAELADIVRQRVYLGRTADQVASTLGISTRAAQQHWALARAWLLRRMKSGLRD
ncbi:MAG: hypothetical protein JSR77_00875 [Planctomycetes bacterium]|nr:hypothetical protein [Planctomycetota bacterium]